MTSGTHPMPYDDQIGQLLKAREIKNVTASAGAASVTVDPHLTVLSVELDEAAMRPERRADLQRDIAEAVNQATREVVMASARALQALQDSPEVRSMQDALQKELDKRSR